MPKLPRANLDDRTYKDLVDECILRIPRYCPEWTNYNASDPGITLIELFAWLTDQMLMRFNQVPRRNYIAFLEMLGISLLPPQPSHTEITFYLTQAQTRENAFPPIAAGTEVATERRDNEEAIIFSTDRDLHIGIPRIRYFLTAEQAHLTLNASDQLTSQIEAVSDPIQLQQQEQQRQQTQNRLQLNDLFANRWREEGGVWSGREQPVFRLQPQVGNCFYLVLEAGTALEGNVVVLTIAGEPAGPTGIDPRRPPRRWEAWDGQQWQPILRDEMDDGTLGFSFDEAGQPVLTAVKEAEVRLHLPLQFPVTEFEGYQGRWLRCVYINPQEIDPQMGRGYDHAPLFSSLSIRSIGGTVPARQCAIVRDELLGETSGKPGQVFELQAQHILSRQPGEQIILMPPPELQSLEDRNPGETWIEVPNFADSTSRDRHYTLDSLTGRIQFGPQVREPGHLREEVQLRRQIQQPSQQISQYPSQQPTLPNGASQPLAPHADSAAHWETLQAHQYGAVPPKGWTVRMQQYRTGGGQQGNVPAETIRILKTAIPYVDRVINYQRAIGGEDAESLDEAVLRVPRLLRTQERAVTAEDFETLTLRSSRAVGRAFCPTQTNRAADRAIVTIYVVPQVAEAPSEQGLAPERLRLSPQLSQTIADYLDERRLLGVEVKLEEPNYVGVTVQAEMQLAPEFQSSEAQETIRRKLAQQLYRFLHPLTGGKQGLGWEFGEPLYRADVAALLQRMPEVRYLRFVELYEWRADVDGGRIHRPDGVVSPGALGLICSCDAQGRGHLLRFSQEDFR
ncbi:MAG: putative baseplate assembly protein [Synechococcales bacterium]|nr:putative baseplate assembly protein [Synechococcales bacterium]